MGADTYNVTGSWLINSGDFPDDSYLRDSSIQCIQVYYYYNNNYYDYYVTTTIIYL